MVEKKSNEIKKRKIGKLCPFFRIFFATFSNGEIFIIIIVFTKSTRTKITFEKERNKPKAPFSRKVQFLLKKK